MTTDRPATEPRPFYDGPVCSRCGHEPHDDRPDPRCPEIVGGWDQPIPTPDYCGCADVDALYGRLVRAEAAPQCPCDEYEPCAEHQSEEAAPLSTRPSLRKALNEQWEAEAAQGAAPRVEWCNKSVGCFRRPGHFGRCTDGTEGAAPRAEGLDGETLRDLKQIIGCAVANDPGDYPCDHDIMVEQFLSRLSRLSRPSDERDTEEPR